MKSSFPHKAYGAALIMPASVSHCGFCGSMVAPDDTLYVSLSRTKRVGYKQHETDAVGFCVPCCPKCLWHWRKRYMKFVVAGFLSLLILAALASYVSQQGHYLWSLAVCVVGGVILYVLWSVLFDVLVFRKLLDSFDVPWVEELVKDGYSLVFTYPRHAKDGKDTKDENGEKVYYLGHGQKLRKYYKWKGCINCYHGGPHTTFPDGAVPGRSYGMLPILLVAIFEFLYIGGLLAIWIGYLALIVYLYFGNGHVGETSFVPVVVSLALAIALTYGYVRLLRLFQN